MDERARVRQHRLRPYRVVSIRDGLVMLQEMRRQKTDGAWVRSDVRRGQQLRELLDVEILRERAPKPGTRE